MRKKYFVLFLLLMSASLLIIGVSSVTQPKEDNSNEFVNPQSSTPLNEDQKEEMMSTAVD